MNGDLLPVLVGLYKGLGREAFKRGITPPQEAVKALTSQTGANFAEAMAQRKVWVEETVQFMEELLISDKGKVGI